jgi:DMSO/TMAO reductase YedYZ molybdopterin-dependent catalytic subunit
MLNDDRFKNEEFYFERRAEQLIDRLEHAGLSRRQVLGLAAAGVPLLAGAGQLARPRLARAAEAASPIVKPLPAEWFVNYGSNAEMRWDAVRGVGYEVPNERFFVRDHTSTPLIDARGWRLKVFGSGLRGQPGADQAVEFSYDYLRSLPARTVTAFVECAGNGRGLFGSQQGTAAPGTQWGLGAIGVARWRGVPLSEVLERAGIRRGAVDVMPQGLDNTVVSGGNDIGHVRRPLPVRKSLDDALLAYEMNGDPLPPDHGFPVRLIVPGWVGIASIKWLGQIEVADQPLFSPFSTTMYRLTGPSYPADQPPLTRQAVKSAFELARGAELPAGHQRVLTGRAWSGDAPIRRVQVSVDGGRSYRDARLVGPNLPGAWVRWHFNWTPSEKGPAELRARATDFAGNTQPDTVPFNDGGYLFWAVVRHPVTIT